MIAVTLSKSVRELPDQKCLRNARSHTLGGRGTTSWESRGAQLPARCRRPHGTAQVGVATATPTCPFAHAVLWIAERAVKDSPREEGMTPTHKWSMMCPHPVLLGLLLR